jgi:hypothetical protein
VIIQLCWTVIAMYNTYNGRLYVFVNSVLRRIFEPKRGVGGSNRIPGQIAY